MIYCRVLRHRATVYCTVHCIVYLIIQLHRYQDNCNGVAMPNFDILYFTIKSIWTTHFSNLKRPSVWLLLPGARPSYVYRSFNFTLYRIATKIPSTYILTDCPSCLSNEGQDEGGGGQDLGDEEEEHDQREEDGDAQGHLLPRLGRQVEDQHAEEANQHRRQDQVHCVEQSLPPYGYVEGDVGLCGLGRCKY